MSEVIKHECGIALIRLKKSLSFYHEKYGSTLYGMNKLQLLLQKMRNRGQDGAGVVTIKLDIAPGHRYISRKRSNSRNYLRDVFEGIYSHFDDCTKEQINNPAWLKANKPYTGEVLLGHLRYGTHGKNTIETVHPFIRQNNWITRNLVLAGNFNMTNNEELFQRLVEFGQYPKERSDTVTVLEKIGHFLDDEVQRLFNWFKPLGYSKKEMNELIFDQMDIRRILQRSARDFDGGYVIGGMIGHGDAFIFRDPNGIRPCFFYEDDEIVAAASERPALQTALAVSVRDIKELPRGHALIIKKGGHVSVDEVVDQGERRACSFERIYFSRGTDRDIYLERKKLGQKLVKHVLKAVHYDFKNTVFSFIPNTAEVAFFGMVDELHREVNKLKKDRTKALGTKITDDDLSEILSIQPRIEKLAVKDAKLRTFIADDSSRGEMVSHVYDVTYGIIHNYIDTIVLIDDSIVRGTTLRNSILKIADRLHPKKIIILSSAPQIRYPDCYGIDMSKMNNFAAFRALVALLKEHKKEDLLDKVYYKCKEQELLPPDQIKNYVQELYNEFSYEEVSNKIGEILTPPDIEAEVEIIYLTVEDLHDACPHNTGDWYFSGNYPTPGGNRVVNQAFINYMEKKNVRAY
ncbi:MAG: amidophosphoribosyltransferase [Bacteroidota bacterium]